MKKRKPKPDHRNTFTFELVVADEETLRPRSRTYESCESRVVARLSMYDDNETLDARGRTYTVRGQPFFPWRQRIWADTANADRRERREAGECSITALACALVGIEGIDMTPLAIIPGEPDVRLAMQDGSEVFVEATQARTPADYQRQVAIRDIRSRVERRVADEHIEIEGNLSFTFRDCPGEREIGDTIDAILAFIRDLPSWPAPGKTIEPESPALAPYCRIGRSLASEPLTFSSDMARLRIGNAVEIVRDALDRKRSNTYRGDRLWLIVDAVLPASSAALSMYDEDEPLGPFERILIYDRSRILDLTKSSV